MKYSVVIPTYNHCDDLLKPCIDSIINCTNLADIELIISANGCRDRTSQYLDELRYFFNSQNLANNIKVVWNDSALGYPKATNLGIKEATTDKIILLNNDCQLLQQSQNEWLKLLEGPFLSNDKCGITCVVKEHSRVMKKDFAIFFCVMIDRKVFDKIGYLNEEYGTGSGEDMEFCVLAQEAGYEICEPLQKTPLDGKYYTGQFPIYHYGEGTVHDKELVPDWSSTFLRNSFRLAKKYNYEWNTMKKPNDKKIAVITPLHNDVDRIFNCINCVKAQTIDNVVHYIYDDASTDGFYEGIQELIKEDKTVQVVRGEENKGQSFGRNTLIERAIADGCEYVAFLDSDDYFMPDHLEKSIPHLTDNDIVYSKPIFVNMNEQVVFPVNIPVPQIFIGKQLLHNNFIWISSVVAKIDCFRESKFDSHLNSIEDWDMWIQLFKKNYKFVDKQDATTRYLVKDNGQASVGNSKMELLKQKYEMLPRLKLHLACGHDYTEGYINVDFYAPDDAVCDVRFDVQKLPYPDNSVDEIKAFHIIEHFHFFEIQEVLKEWHRVLKPGGRLYLETPDFLETCRSFVEGSPVMHIEDWRVLLYGHFFAHAWVPGQTHKFLFTETQLRTNLDWAGFKQVNRLPPASKYVMDHTAHLFLNVEAFK
jgi:glycosyltransferase involved in cell wall biosynthesis